MDKRFNILMIGATGAVGMNTISALSEMEKVDTITTLVRRKIDGGLVSPKVKQEIVDLFDVSSYDHLCAGHNVAICTLGVGQPSKMSKEDFVKIDKDLVLQFAKTCKINNIEHFELLSSVGISASSSSFYLRTKGELVAELIKLDFPRLSIFQPSMILTPENRYGLMQGITLAVWPWLHPLLIGGLNKFKGIKVENLGKAMATNIIKQGKEVEMLTWQDFQRLIEVSS